MSSSLLIPDNLLNIWDYYHVDSLYKVCRFCYIRLSPKDLPKKNLRQPPTNLVIDRAYKFYNIDLRAEIIDLFKPKVFCCSCRSRLSDLESGKLNIHKWLSDRSNIESNLNVEIPCNITRKAILCVPTDRCHLCKIYSSSMNNHLSKLKTQGPNPGRPLEQSPVRLMCSKCGMSTDVHDIDFCKQVMKRPQSSRQAGKHFAERVESRGYTENLTTNFLVSSLEGSVSDNSLITPFNALSLRHPFDSNNQLAVATIPYKSAKQNISNHVLSREAVRDMQKLGHLGLGKKSYFELGRILRKEGIHFPTGGIKGAWDEKWSIFGEIFTSLSIKMIRSETQNFELVPMGICTDVERLLNIITYKQSNRISRLKVQLDGGKQFLKLSVNIVSMLPNSLYIANPNSVLSNFVIAMGHASENSENLRSLLNLTSIRNIFNLDIPIQIACDFKVAAMLVGIQQASSKHPCPFCIWRKNTKCTGTPLRARRYNELIKDFHSKTNSVSHEPIIKWSDLPMEILALAPLHILLGLVNRLYGVARPSQNATNRYDRLLYKQHCQALQRCKVYRSEYWDGALEGNSCSRLLDNLDIIPFPSHHTSLLNALKSLKMVKDRCLGLLRKPGWEESICLFRESWDATGLPWSLKSHILSDHYMEYFFHYEPQLTAGAAISSEQSGEMLHSRIQNLWDLRF